MAAPTNVQPLREVSPETTPAAPPMFPTRKSAGRRRAGYGLLISTLLCIVVPVSLAALFYAQIAANQYVSEFKLALRGPERSLDGGNPGASGGIGPSSLDAFVVTELINSRQMVTDVGRVVDLRKVFASPKADFYYRLRLPATQEDLIDHWKKVVAAHFDMLTGIVTVSVRTFSPEESLLVARAIAKAADDAVFKMSERARQDLVRFADEDVKRAEAGMQRARLALRDFRVQEQIMDATKTAAASSDLVSQYRAELSRLYQQLSALGTQLAASSPQIQQLKTQIAATEREIARLSKSVGEGVGRNTAELSPTVLAQFDSLSADLQIAEKVYGSVLEGRQRAQANADRRTSYVTLFVEPSLPDASLFPQRTTSVVLVALISAMTWFLGLLVIASIRDHLL